MDDIDGPLDYVKELINRFNSDECAAWAASLSFFAILSIAPVLLCGLAILGFFIHDPHEAAKQVLHIVSNLLPDRASAKLLISQFNIEQSAATLKHSAPRAAVIGILSLIWASLQIFVNAVAPMNAAYRAKESRNWLKLRLSALALLIVTGFLFLLSLLPTSGIALFNHLDLGHLPDPPAPLIATFLVFLGLVINALMFTVIYRYLPSPAAKTTLKSAAVAGSVIALLWELAKTAFGFYLARFANYNKIYGSLGGLIALILWIYYSSMILLLGAEIAKLYQDSREAATTGKVAG